MGGRGQGATTIAPGARVEVRDEEWLVTKVEETNWDGTMVHAVGLSELVRDQEGIFSTELDAVVAQDPTKTELVFDESPAFVNSRLHLDALLRRTPLPITETRPAVGHKQLLRELEYQKRAVKIALEQPRPRLLIADSVGLGKTLEIGMILSELIRRGRGERIMVVTPRHILEQFQHELWTRFSIPLVRLDSKGIQRVRRKIPATRNPFSYFKRVVISIDTLKDIGRYGHHLDNLRWDAVVIDECHGITNRSTERHRLAATLAPKANALILASATPHNGKRESFAELITMLDPTAIADKADYGHEDIDHLYVRRFKKDVIAEVSSDFPERAEPLPILIDASPEENGVIDELDSAWLHPEGSSPTTGKGSRLFPWSLLKAFLSSHVALTETIDNRLATIRPATQEGDRDALAEAEALRQLRSRAEAVDETSASKLDRLVEELTTIGVGRRSETRVVVFSERIGTLRWLRDELLERLNLPESAIALMHGGLPDTEQMEIVEQFGQREGKIRILLSGDVASEGVNLHRECHNLIHYDLPWSVIRIDQRNGRIDRYGQTHRPEIRALLLNPDNERLRGDLRVLRRLLEKEHEIHQTIGDAAALMGLNDIDAEEDAIERGLAEGKAAEEVVPESPEGFDVLDFLDGNETSGETGVVPTAEAPKLFSDDAEFVEQALRRSFDGSAWEELELRRESGSAMISLAPPPDLTRRLSGLPQSYLREQGVDERLRLTTDRDEAERSLTAARQSGDSMWPRVGWLGAQHPLLEWLTDKVLAQSPRGTAPAFRAAVTEPTLLVQAMYSNRFGQPTVVEWLAISGLDGDDPQVEDLHAVLVRAGVNDRMTNRGEAEDVERAQAMIPRAVEVARAHIEGSRDEAEAGLNERLEEMRGRAVSWRQEALDLARSEGARRNVVEAADGAEALSRDMRSNNAPLIRVVGAILPD